MAKHIEDEVVYYYDLYPTEEDLMGETSVHASLVRYLMEVLTWLFWGQQCAIYDNLNFYQTRDPEEHPLATIKDSRRGLPVIENFHRQLSMAL